MKTKKLNLYFEKKNKIFIRNANILCGESFEVIKGFIKIENGVITEIGEGSARGSNFLDAKNGIIMPAFTNAHVHLLDCSAIDEGFYLPIEKRVGKGGVKFSAIENAVKTGKIDNYVSTCLREMIHSGTTTFCEFREFDIDLNCLDTTDSSIKKIFDHKILGRVFSGEKNFREKVRRILRKYDGFGVSSVFDYSEEERKIISEETKKAKKLLAVHAGEVLDDIKETLKINPDFIVHATNISEESLELISREKVPVVICAKANASFAVGLPNIKELYEKTVVALGTDNAMANSLDMFREVEFVFKIARALSRDWSFEAKYVLKMATINGRKILGLESNSVEEGNYANLILLRKKYECKDIVTAVVNRYSYCDVKSIINKDILIIRK